VSLLFTPEDPYILPIGDVVKKAEAPGIVESRGRLVFSTETKRCAKTLEDEKHELVKNDRKRWYQHTNIEQLEY